MTVLFFQSVKMEKKRKHLHPHSLDIFSYAEYSYIVSHYTALTHRSKRWRADNGLQAHTHSIQILCLWYRWGLAL